MTDYKSINIGEIEIPFNSNWNSIAIAVSGGADSALLAFLLCHLIHEHNAHMNVHVISNIRCWKTRPWQQTVSQTVYDWLVQKFYSTIQFRRHENFVPPELEHGASGQSIVDEYGRTVSGDTLELRAFAEFVCCTHNVDAYFNAVTKNPPIDIPGRLPARDIAPTDNNQHLAITKHLGKWSCHPFRFVDKSWVIQQYKQFDIMDLLAITRSCEGEFVGINYTTYKPGQEVPVCGDCFWCKEREWGIEQNK